MLRERRGFSCSGEKQTKKGVGGKRRVELKNNILIDREENHYKKKRCRLGQPGGGGGTCTDHLKPVHREGIATRTARGSGGHAQDVYHIGSVPARSSAGFPDQVLEKQKIVRLGIVKTILATFRVHPRPIGICHERGPKAARQGRAAGLVSVGVTRRYALWFHLALRSKCRTTPCIRSCSCTRVRDRRAIHGSTHLGGWALLRGPIATRCSPTISRADLIRTHGVDGGVCGVTSRRRARIPGAARNRQAARVQLPSRTLADAR